MSNKKACLIIPCFNEETRINASAFSDFISKQPDIDLLLVNDGSLDNTLQKLNAMKASSNRINVLNLEKNGGKSEAVRQGMLYLLKTSNYQMMGYWDADLSTPLEDSLKMKFLMEQTPSLEMIFGSRTSTHENRIERSFLRRISSRLFSLLVQKMIKLQFNDTQCGAKMVSRDLIVLLFEFPFLSRWFFDVEILTRFFQGGHGKNQVLELPVSQWIHQDGSKITIKDFLSTHLELSKIRKFYKI